MRLRLKNLFHKSFRIAIGAATYGTLTHPNSSGVGYSWQEEGRNRPMAEAQLKFPEVAFTGSA